MKKYTVFLNGRVEPVVFNASDVDASGQDYKFVFAGEGVNITVARFPRENIVGFLVEQI